MPTVMPFFYFNRQKSKLRGIRACASCLSPNLEGNLLEWAGVVLLTLVEMTRVV